MLSLAWAGYRTDITSEKLSVAWLSITLDFLANFLPAFFLLSWMMGQLYRVKKQQRVEDELQHVKTELNTLLQSIKHQTRHLIGHTTGGDSVGYFTPSVYVGTQRLSIGFLNDSEYPVFDVFAEWIDLDESIEFEKGKFWTRHSLSIGTVHSHKIAMEVFWFDMTARERLRINIFLQTRNSGGSQQFRVAKVGGQIKIAVKTDIGNFHQTGVPDDFPNYDPSNPDLVFK